MGSLYCSLCDRTRSQNVLDQIPLQRGASFPFGLHNSPSMATDNDDQDFAFHVNSHAVSLLAKKCGFDSIQRSALHTLTETLEDCEFFFPVTMRDSKTDTPSNTPDLENLLAKTHLYAELGNRTRPNYHDVIRSLEESGIQLSEFGNYLNQHREDRGKDIYIYICIVYYGNELVLIEAWMPSTYTTCKRKAKQSN